MWVRRATEDDAARVAEIYNWYIRHTIITFETEAVSSQDMMHRIQEKLRTTTGSSAK
jgi:phosphinothricin acetyltransferase